MPKIRLHKLEKRYGSTEVIHGIDLDMQEDEFTTTGLASLVVLVLSIICLPLLLQKRKRLKRVIAARNRRTGIQSTVDEFDDFFE